ncbi:MAG TPA: ABC transporter substrate-binding protein [Chryseolinea sp.]|nr:ABC transporter substrate-binding protein [Chryseolinea sp.]
MKKVITLLLCCAIVACENRRIKDSEEALAVRSTSLSYAEGFTIEYQGRNKLVEVKYPFQGATSGFKYLLVPRGDTIPAHAPDVRVITIPLNSIVCTSTTHIPLLEYLDEGTKLIGFPSTDYISSRRIRDRIDSGKVQELGVDRGMNLERLAALKPDMVMGYTMNSDYGQFKKMDELNIPVVINAEYLEKHPLGRAEWIKFMALFFNKEKQADSVFKVIERSYLDVKNLADSVANKPTVLSGIVYSDAWFLPGGQNYASRILHDAGCAYLWEENTSNGYLELSFESVYEKAHDADLWIGVGNYTTLKDLGTGDHRYTRFKPFRTGSVYTYDARKGAKGGSEFLELGYLRPDLILRDLVKIAHPDLLKDHELYFHKQLK